MDDVFQQLISIWRKAELADDPESIADALWLAPFLPPSAKPSAPTMEPISTPAPGAAPEPPATPPQAPPTTQSTAIKQSDEKQGGIFTRPAAVRVDKSIPASPVTIAAAAALPNPLILSRALRPFSRRFASRNRTEFDEERTAEDTAYNHRPTPRYRPLPERWFDIALVVEDTPSMSIWRRTVQEFRILLERQGSFRDVRTWRLKTGGVLLDRQTIRRPAAINDVAGRRLILIVSDCVSADWYNGVFASLLLRWGKQTPVGIVQVLPPRAWTHTALGEPSTRLHSPRAGLPTAALAVDRGWWTPEPSGSSISVPVIPLDAVEVQSWARMSMAMGGAAYPGVLLDAKPPEPSGAAESVQTMQEPRRLVDAYRSMVSTEAFQLAGYLAATPLSLPVMRLVQQAMFGNRTRQFHLAEFFLGGLIRKVADATDPEEAEYDFHDGVRDILLETLPRNDAFEVIRQVSRFIESRVGQPLDWKALVPDPAGKFQLPATALPFAKIAQDVLGRMGARQAAVSVVEEPSPSLENVLRGHTGPVTSVVVTKLDDRVVIVSAGDDRTVRVWDLGSETLIRSMPGPLHPVLAIDQSAPGTNLVYGGGEDGIARSWDLRTGIEHKMFEENSPITAIAPPSLWGYESGAVCLFDAGESAEALGSHRNLGQFHKRPVNALVIMPHVVSAGFGSTADDSTRFFFQFGSGGLGPAKAMVVTSQADNALAILGDTDGKISFSSISVHEANISVHGGVGEPLQQPPVTSLSLLHQSGAEYLVSGSTDGQLRVWNIDTRQLSGSPIPVHQGQINSVALTEIEGAGWVAISAGDDALVRITALRSLLSTHRKVMIWQISPTDEFSESITKAIAAAGHEIITWERTQSSRDQLPSCDHLVAIISGKLEKGTFNPYEEAIQCRPFFLALGPEAEDPTSMKDATRINFREPALHQQSLRSLLDAIEITPPIRVAGLYNIPVIFDTFRRRALELTLKTKLLDPAGPEEIYLAGAEPQECSSLAFRVAQDCEIRRAFPKGIFAAYEAFQASGSRPGRALLVTQAGLWPPPQWPLADTRVLITDTNSHPATASIFEIPPVSLEETSDYLAQRGLLQSFPGNRAEQVTALHQGSARLLQIIVEMLLFAGPDKVNWRQVASSKNVEDSLIEVAVNALDPDIRRTAEGLTVFREGDWVPWPLIYAFGQSYTTRLQALGVLEQSPSLSARRLHPSARSRFPVAPSTAHAAVVAHYAHSGSPSAQTLKAVPPDGYFDANIEYHLHHAKMDAAAIDLLSDFSWLSRKLTNVGIRRLLSDLVELRDIATLQVLNDVLGASASLLEAHPEGLASALLRYSAESNDPLAQLQASASAERNDIYRTPTFFVLVSGTGLGPISESVSTISQRLGRELARNGFGLITGGWDGVDEITARAYLAERSRLGFAESKAALIQFVGTRSLKILEEGEVRHPDVGEQAEAVQRANAVVLVEGKGGVMETYRHAQRQNKPVFPIGATGGDAMRVFLEMVRAGILYSEDPLGRTFTNAEGPGRAVDAAMGRLFLASQPPIDFIISDPGLISLVLEYLTVRATEWSGPYRTAKISEVMRQMQSLALRFPVDQVPSLLQHVNRGLRLVGIARQFASPHANLLDELALTLTTREDTAFGQYWCLRALQNTLRSGKAPMPETVEKRLRGFQPKLGASSDRGQILASLLAEFGTPLGPNNVPAS